MNSLISVEVSRGEPPVVCEQPRREVEGRVRVEAIGRTEGGTRGDRGTQGYSEVDGSLE